MEACNQALKIDEALSQYFGQAQAFTETGKFSSCYTSPKSDIWW